MLLRFFRINDPYRLLGLLILLIVLGLVFFIGRPPLTIPELKGILVGEAITGGQQMYTQVIDSTGPLMAGFLGIMEWLFGRAVIARQLVALLIIFLQASFFGILLINNKAYNDSTYVPALIFAVLCFFSFDLLSFSPELVGSTVLLLSLNYLFKEIEFRNERDEIILNLGVCLGIATLILFSYIVYFLITVLILFVFSRPSIRKVILLLFGFLLPHALLTTVYYFRGEAEALWDVFYRPNLTVHGTIGMNAGGLLLLCAVPLAYFVFSIFMLNREARFTKYQSQLFQVMFFWMLAGVLQLFITRELSPRSLIIFVPSLAYFISHYLLLIRRKWIGETMLWIFLIGILGMSLMAQHGRIATVSYERLTLPPSPYEGLVKDKSVMTAVDDIGLFRQNRSAGYFLDWSLSRNYLEHPEFYESIILADASLRRYPPDIIVDPNNLMNPFFERMPEMRSRYFRDGNLYRRIPVGEGGKP